MANWPVFCSADDVTCQICGNVVGQAKDGSIAGFGDGHGNRSLRCEKCGWTTCFDIVRSTKKRDEHMKKHAEEFARLPVQIKRVHAIEPVPGLTGIDRQAPKASSPKQKQKPRKNAFDIGALITEEVNT